MGTKISLKDLAPEELPYEDNVKITACFNNEHKGVFKFTVPSKYFTLGIRASDKKMKFPRKMKKSLQHILEVVTLYNKKRYKKLKQKQKVKDKNLFNRPKVQCSKEEWEWLFFRKRVEVRCMKVILNYDSEKLLNWYKEHYPEDKVSQMYCRQNLNKWDKFNNKV